MGTSKDKDYFFIQKDGTPADKLHIRGPQGVKTLSAEDAYMKALLREGNLTEGELEVLNLVKKESGKGMATRIADALGKERSWVSYVLNRLCETGHVKKVERGIFYAR